MEHIHYNKIKQSLVKHDLQNNIFEIQLRRNIRRIHADDCVIKPRFSFDFFDPNGDALHCAKVIVCNTHQIANYVMF